MLGVGRDRARPGRHHPGGGGRRGIAHDGSRGCARVESGAIGRAGSGASFPGGECAKPAPGRGSQTSGGDGPDATHGPRRVARSDVSAALDVQEHDPGWQGSCEGRGTKNRRARSGDFWRNSATEYTPTARAGREGTIRTARPSSSSSMPQPKTSWTRVGRSSRWTRTGRS